MPEHKTCGVATRICATCRHHQSCHRNGTCRRFTGERQPCARQTQAEPCHAFSALPCNSRPMANGRCRMHMGNAPRGAANPAYAGKGYSKYLPTGMADRYEQILSDPDRLSLQFEVALLRSQLVEVLEQQAKGQQFDIGAAYAACDALENAFRAVQRVQGVTDERLRAERLNTGLVALGEALQAIRAALAAAGAERAVRRETKALAESIEKLTRSENTRIVELQGMIT